ncbi:MAG: DUF2231 domain-containing protein [Myxococcota bacterium]
MTHRFFKVMFFKGIAQYFLCVTMLVSLQAMAHPNHKEVSKNPETPAVNSAASEQEIPTDVFGDDEEFQTIDEIEVIETTDPHKDESANTLSNSFLSVVGYFHAAMTHAPIAWIMLLVLIDALYFFGGRQQFQNIGYYLLLLSLCSMAPAIASGLARLDGLKLSGTDLEAALLHRNIMFACLGMLLVATVLRVSTKNNLLGTKRFAYMGFIAVTFALVGFGAHKGGVMIFGEPPL